MAGDRRGAWHGPRSGIDLRPADRPEVYLKPSSEATAAEPDEAHADRIAARIADRAMLAAREPGELSAWPHYRLALAHIRAIDLLAGTGVLEILEGDLADLLRNAFDRWSRWRAAI
jgi:hypothetical protein